MLLFVNGLKVVHPFPNHPSILLSTLKVLFFSGVYCMCGMEITGREWAGAGMSR